MNLMDNRLPFEMWSTHEASCSEQLEAKIYFVSGLMETYISIVICYKKISYELIILICILIQEGG
jgi:hypothetical protein